MKTDFVVVGWKKMKLNSVTLSTVTQYEFTQSMFLINVSLFLHESKIKRLSHVNISVCGVCGVCVCVWVGIVTVKVFAHVTVTVMCSQTFFKTDVYYKEGTYIHSSLI